MGFNIALMAAGAFITSQGISARTGAKVAAANSLERQNYEEMKRAKLGGIIDHNKRVEQFRAYEDMLVLAGQGRQDRSIKAIRTGAKTKSLDAMQSAQIRTLGQMSVFAGRSQQAALDRSAAQAEGRNAQMMNAISFGMKMYQVV